MSLERPAGHHAKDDLEPPGHVKAKLDATADAMCVLFGGARMSAAHSWSPGASIRVSFPDVDSAVSFSACFQYALLHSEWSQQVCSCCKPSDLTPCVAALAVVDRLSPCRWFCAVKNAAVWGPGAGRGGGGGGGPGQTDGPQDPGVPRIVLQGPLLLFDSHALGPV